MMSDYSRRLRRLSDELERLADELEAPLPAPPPPPAPAIAEAADPGPPASEESTMPAGSTFPTPKTRERLDAALEDVKIDVLNAAGLYAAALDGGVPDDELGGHYHRLVDAARALRVARAATTSI